LYYKLDLGVVQTIGVEKCLDGGCIGEEMVGGGGVLAVDCSRNKLASLNNEISRGMGLSPMILGIACLLVPASSILLKCL